MMESARWPGALAGLVVVTLLGAAAVAEEGRGRASRSLPSGREIRQVQIVRCTPGSPRLRPAALRRIIDRARPLSLSDPRSDPFHYSPWCAGTFAARGGTYRFLLFLGGRGDLTLPGGSRIRFEFEP